MLKKNRCGTTQARLWAWAAQTMDAEERETVAQHLAVCANCRREAAEYEATLALLAAFRAEIVPSSQTNWPMLEAAMQARKADCLRPAFGPNRRLAMGFAALFLLTGFVWHSYTRPDAAHIAPNANVAQVPQTVPPSALPEKTNPAALAFVPPASPDVQAIKPDAEPEAKTVHSTTRTIRSHRRVVRFPVRHRRHSKAFVLVKRTPPVPSPALPKPVSLQVARNVDEKCPAAPVPPVNYVMTQIEIAVSLNDSRRYVMGQIPAASDNPDKKEKMQPW